MRARVTTTELAVEDNIQKNKVRVVICKGDKGDTGYPTDEQVTTAVDSILAEHPEWTTTVEDGAITEAKLNSALAEDIARVDGTYPDLTAGDMMMESAEQDNAPYLMRKSVAVGKNCEDKLVGGSIAYNQLANESTVTINGVTKSFVDGKFDLNNSATQAGIIYLLTAQNFAGHKLLFLTSNLVNSQFSVGVRDFTHSSWLKNTSVGAGFPSCVISVPSDCVSCGMYINFIETASFNHFQFRCQVFDLTQMFGSAIADYIYSLETATAGSGISWLKSYGFFLKPYYPYNAGELMSVKTTGHKMVGFNQLPDGIIPTQISSYSTALSSTASAQFISILKELKKYKQPLYYKITPSSTTTQGVPVGQLRLYNSSATALKHTISPNAEFDISEWDDLDESFKILFYGVTPASAITFSDICINISSSLNGTYQPYEEHIYQTGMRNIWDEQWEEGSLNLTTGEPKTESGKIRSKNFIPVIEGTYYVKSANNVAVCCYGADYSFIDRVSGSFANTTFNTLTGTHYIKFYTSGTTYTSGEIEFSSPYELRGLFKLNGNSLYCDGDILDGNKVTRKYGLYTFTGNETWTPNSMTPPTVKYISGWSSGKNVKLPSADSVVANILCPSLPAKSIADIRDNGALGIGLYTGGSLGVSYSYDTTQLVGKAIIYELATATTETTEEYTTLQKSFPNGTETYIDTRDVPIPVGHITEYHRDGQPFLNDLGDYADWSADNIALKEMVTGTLRQLLAVKHSISFLNTAWVDLSTLTWTYVPTYTLMRASFSQGKASGGCLCTRYESRSTEYTSNDKSISIGTSGWQNGYLTIRDTSYTDATSFKKSLQGVILAYEKA